MTEHRLMITGVHYAANPEQVAGQPDTEEMHVRTLEMLRWVRDEAPFVVLAPTSECHENPDAVAARVLGRRIGYVGDDWLQTARDLLAQSGEPMVVARVTEVAVERHGWLWVTVDADELTSQVPLSSMQIDWEPWMSGLPLLPKSDAEEAEQEAAFVLDHVLLKDAGKADLGQLKTYFGIWLRGSRHDLSREARQQRALYIERIMAAESQEVRRLADGLIEQRKSICGRTMLDERTSEWWPERMASEGARRLWQQWRLGHDNRLWSGLREIDNRLRQLPGALYEDIGRLDEIFSRLYYMNTPRQALCAILALVMLRQLTCRELGIEMRPMTESDYGQDGLVSNPMDIPTTLGCIREYGKSQCDKTQRQTIELLVHWLRDHYEQSLAQQPEPPQATMAADASRADAVTLLLRQLMEGKQKPKDVLMPVRAAMDAGAIRRPTWEEFGLEFGAGRVKNKSSFSDYTNPDKQPYTGADFLAMKEKFRQLMVEGQ